VKDIFIVARVIQVYVFLHEIRHLGRHLEKWSNIQNVFAPLMPPCNELSNGVSHVWIFHPVQKLDGGLAKPPFGTNVTKKRFGSRGLYPDFL